MGVQSGKFYDAIKMRDYCDKLKDEAAAFAEYASLHHVDINSYHTTEGFKGVTAREAKKFVKSGVGNMLKGVSYTQEQMEKADLRIALFLPNSFQMTRIPVEAGSHEVSVAAEGDAGNTVNVFNFGSIDVKKGEKKFIFVPAIK